MIHERYYAEAEKQEELIRKKNNVDTSFYNGIFDRYENPVLTRDHAPIIWRYDIDETTNPFFEERLGINAVMNSGAIELMGTAYTDNYVMNPTDEEIARCEYFHDIDETFMPIYTALWQEVKNAK